MKTLLTPLFSLAFLITALDGASASASGQSLAVLQTAVSQPKEAVIDGKLWKCAGVDCASGAGGSGQPIGRECARVVHVLGAVASFSRDGQSLDTAALAACNKG